MGTEPTGGGWDGVWRADFARDLGRHSTDRPLLAGGIGHLGRPAVCRRGQRLAGAGGAPKALALLQEIIVSAELRLSQRGGDVPPPITESSR